MITMFDMCAFAGCEAEEEMDNVCRAQGIGRMEGLGEMAGASRASRKGCYLIEAWAKASASGKEERICAARCAMGDLAPAQALALVPAVRRRGLPQGYCTAGELRSMLARFYSEAGLLE